jgi:hypothetical protein
MAVRGDGGQPIAERQSGHRTGYGQPQPVRVQHHHARQGVGAIGRVESLALQIPPGSGLLTFGVREATARAAGVCVAGQPVLDGTSDVNGVSIAGQELPIGQFEQQLATQLAPLGLVVDLKIDEQLRSGSSLIVRALHLRVLSAAGTPVVDLIAAEARVAFTGTVCDPTGQTRVGGADSSSGKNAGGSNSMVPNGVRGGTCGLLKMYFARNKTAAFCSRYGRRAVVRGKIVNCKGARSCAPASTSSTSSRASAAWSRPVCARAPVAS